MNHKIKPDNSKWRDTFNETNFCTLQFFFLLLFYFFFLICSAVFIIIFHSHSIFAFFFIFIFLLVSEIDRKQESSYRQKTISLMKEKAKSERKPFSPQQKNNYHWNAFSSRDLFHSFHFHNMERRRKENCFLVLNLSFHVFISSRLMSFSFISLPIDLVDGNSIKKFFSFAFLFLGFYHCRAFYHWYNEELSTT